MYIESIDLKDFRNYERLSLRLNKGTNVIYGDNAQGKTNLLEAIQVSFQGRSLRGAGDSEIIRFDQEESHIKLMLMVDERPLRIDIHLKKNKNKGIALNGIPVKKASDLLGRVKTVTFSPEDISLVKEGPSKRRNFLDTELCQLDSMYVYCLSNYNKALKQKNKLLKEIYFYKDLKETLSSWNEMLVRFGKEIISKRRDFIKEISEIASKIHLDISGNKEFLEIGYEENTGEEEFLKRLIENEEMEIKMKTSLYGPHRDDMILKIAGRDIRKFGSQGQKRTAALSLKLAEIELIKEKGEIPVVLLDDVMSELDSVRQELIIKRLKDTQNIITCTGIDEFIENKLKPDEIFKVSEGRIIREEGIYGDRGKK